MPELDATPESPPVVSLTIQAALPGTLLADGQTIPSPGQSVIVKLLNDETPNNTGPANLQTTYGSTGSPAIQNAGAGFVVGVEDGVDPPAQPDCVDPGAYSELRILGIPGQPDDRPAARAGDHHLAARRHASAPRFAAW